VSSPRHRTHTHSSQCKRTRKQDRRKCQRTKTSESKRERTKTGEKRQREMTLRRMDNVLIVVTLADAGRPRSLCDSACSAGSLWPSLITRTNRFTNVGRSCGPAGIATVPPCPFVEHSQGRRLRSGTPSTQRTRANQSPRPVSGRIGSHRNGAGATTLSRSISTRRRFEPRSSRTATRCLHSPSEFLRSRRSHNCHRAARSDLAACGTRVRATCGAWSRTVPAAGSVKEARKRTTARNRKTTVSRPE
jgi:hypothetical protein